MTKETAFHPRLAAATSEWIDLFGYWAPAVVTDVEAEYRAVRQAAGLMDFSMLRKIDIDGERAVELVDSVVTRSIADLPLRHIAYGALCDESGKMIDDCTVMMRGPGKVRFCGANDRDGEIFRAKAQTMDIEVAEFTDEMPHLCVQGPASRDILSPLANKDISDKAFPYYTFREDIEIGGIPVFMTRMGYTAELGYELWVTRSNALALWDLLIEAGTPAGMKVIGMQALDLFRVEGGFIIGGVEYDGTVSPYECGLGWAVDLDKGDFQGRDGIVRDKSATRFRLTSVMLESGGDKASGATLFVDGHEVGAVTQAIESPHLNGKTLALAKIDKMYRVPGVGVDAYVNGVALRGEVVAHPVYDPSRTRAKKS